MWANSSRNRKTKVDGTLGPVVVSFCCSLCQSLFPLGSITAYTNSCCPARYKHNPSAVRWSQELGAWSMFNISILLIPPWGEAVFGKIVLQDQHEVDGHLVYSAGNPQMANTTHSLGSVSQQTEPQKRLQQSVRPGPARPGPARPSLTSDQRPQTKPGRLDQTNDPVCVGRWHVSLNREVTGLCTLLFIAAFIWGRIDFVKARRLSHPREQSLWGSQGCVAPHATLDGEELCTGVLLSSLANMPPLDHRFCESCYKSFLLQWKHLLWLPALLLANVIVIIIPGRLRFSVIMSATLMRRGGQHKIIRVKNILRGRMTFKTAVGSWCDLCGKKFCVESWTQTGGIRAEY